jgi:hypothetical protein
MALVSEPDRMPEPVLRELVRSLREDLQESAAMIAEPRGRVLDPASLRTAAELLEAARATLDRPGERTRAELAADANLAYATMVALIDLVKSHTDVPKVPPPRSVPPGT